MNYFYPSIERAKQSDSEQRKSLANTIDYLFDLYGEYFKLDVERGKNLANRLRAEPLDRNIYANYWQLLSGIDNQDEECVKESFDELLTHETSDNPLRICSFSNDQGDPLMSRYAKILTSESDTPLPLMPPPNDLSSTASKTAREALDLIREASPELHDEITWMLHDIVFAVGNIAEGYDFDGGTNMFLWGVIFVNAEGNQKRLKLAQTITHESCHNLIFGYQLNDPLTKNAPGSRYPSPLRDDLRPMDGIYHATIVTARMHFVTKKLLEANSLTSDEQETAETDLREFQTIFANGVETVETHAELTDMGRELLEHSKEYMRLN